MKLALIELESYGHHYQLYLKNIILTAQKLNITLYVVLGKRIKKYFNLPKSKNINYFFLSDLKYPKKKYFFNFFFFQIRNYFILKKLYYNNLKNLNLNHIYINNLDHYDKGISIFGSPFQKTNFSGIFLSPKIKHRVNLNFKQKILKALFKKLLNIKYLTKIAVTNPILFKNIKYLKKSKITLLNEISDKKFNNNLKTKIIENFKLKYQITKKDLVLLVYGSIRLEKGIEYLLPVMLDASLSKSLKLIIAGKQNEEFRNYLKKVFQNYPNLKNKIIVINKFINNDLENLLFHVTDYTWVGYNVKFDGSSGVLFLSLFHKKPVIGHNNGLISYYIKNLNVGHSVNLKNKYLLIKLFNNLKKKKISQKKYLYIRKKFSVRNFTKIIFDDLIDFKRF